MSITDIVVTVVASLYTTIGARQARRMYVRLHQDWWDEKIAARREKLKKSGKKEEPGQTLRILRREWENGRDAQGMAMALSLITFLMWPVVMPLFALAKDPAPSNEEQKLIDAELEAEIERLRREQGQ